ncbi:chitinase [Metarhizium brunneum]
MSSSPAGPSRISGTETYLDYTLSPDINFDHIKSTMTCTKFHDSIWGFVIYRCSQGEQTAWDRLLQALRRKVQEDASGATSHQVRDHFESWVPKNLEDRLRPDATNSQNDVGVHATSTPRYEYCLFVDDVCLESVDHPGVNSPVVKLLHKNWESPFPPQERNYTVPAPSHDGATEYHEEDVGWMYMPLQEYLYKYDLLGKGDWDDQYVRPPYIDGTEDEGGFVGHWRQEA